MMDTVLYINQTIQTHSTPFFIANIPPSNFVTVGHFGLVGQSPSLANQGFILILYPLHTYSPVIINQYA